MPFFFFFPLWFSFPQKISDRTPVDSSTAGQAAFNLGRREKNIHIHRGLLSEVQLRSKPQKSGKGLGSSFLFGELNLRDKFWLNSSEW